MRTKLEEGETTKWRVYQVGRGARLRPGVAPREREGGVDAGRRVRCTDTSPLMNAPGMCEGFYVRRRRRRRRHHSRHPSSPFSLRHHYHQPRIGRHPRRPTSASSHPSPPTLPQPLPLSSSFSSSSSLVLHPSSFTHPSPCRSSRNPFLSKELNSGPPPSRAALNPVFPHAALNALHSSQREADARRSPGSSVGGFRLVRRNPPLLGLCPVFASSCVPADVPCTRDWYAQPPVRESSPAPAPRPLLSSLLVYPLSRFTRLPLPSHSRPPAPSLTPSLLSLPPPPSRLTPSRPLLRPSVYSAVSRSSSGLLLSLFLLKGSALDDHRAVLSSLQWLVHDGTFFLVVPA